MITVSHFTFFFSNLVPLKRTPLSHTTSTERIWQVWVISLTVDG